MPLAFSSQSHGDIAFGFFNIDTDMLLLESLFFFADDFCAAVLALDEHDTAELSGWRIAEPAAVGSLHGAIAGRELSGFIGATYAAWPFPSAPEGFKQCPDGARHRAETEAMIGGFGEAEIIALRRDDGVCVGAYRFALSAFALLLAYVDRGGYPRWRDERRPSYVQTMVERLRATGSTLMEQDTGLSTTPKA
jgi:hypothetical protein